MHDGRQALHLINCIEIFKRARGKEESVSFLEGHGAAEFGLIIVVAQVSDLVQVAVMHMKGVN